MWSFNTVLLSCTVLCLCDNFEFVTMSGAEQNLDDSVVHYCGSEALMMSCRAILVVRVCVGVRLTHEKPPAARTARRRRSRH